MDRSPRLLILLRHAKSDWSGDEVDRLRPLAARGRRQAPEAGRWLAANVEGVDLACVSPATRARQTWELVSAELPQPPSTRFDDRIYAADEDALLDVVRGLADEVNTVVVVGHNPGLEDFASSLAGRPVTMPTSAMAVFAVIGGWSEAGPSSVELRAAGRPPADETGS